MEVLPARSWGQLSYPQAVPVHLCQDHHNFPPLGSIAGVRDVQCPAQPRQSLQGLSRAMSPQLALLGPVGGQAVPVVAPLWPQRQHTGLAHPEPFRSLWELQVGGAGASWEKHGTNPSAEQLQQKAALILDRSFALEEQQRN